MWSRAWNSRFGSPSRLVHLGAAVSIAGEVGAGVPVAVDHALDEGVPGLAVRRDRGDADRAVLVGDVLGLAEDGRSGRASLLDALVDVGHLERDVDDAVAVRGVVRHQGAVGADGAVDHEPDRAGLQHERLVVAVAVLGSGVGDQLHAPGARVVVRGLGGVADHEDDRVPAGHREDVVVRVVVDQPDQLVQLLEGQVGLHFVNGQGAAGGGNLSRHGDNHAQLETRCATVRQTTGQSVY